MTRSALILGALLGLLALPVTASAHKPTKHHRHHTRPQVARKAPVVPVHANPQAEAQAIAAAYWGSAPCDGAITVRENPVTPEQEADIVRYYGHPINPAAWSEWDSPTGPQSKQSSPSTYTDCVVTFNATVWPGGVAYEAQPEVFPWYCMAMVHEYGNLWGIPETEAPGIMSFAAPTVPSVCD